LFSVPSSVLFQNKDKTSFEKSKKTFFNPLYFIDIFSYHFTQSESYEMPKLNILVIPADRHGIGKFRSLDPHIYLQNKYGEDFHVDIDFNPPMNDEYFLKYQIVHFHTFIYRTDDYQQSCDLTLQRIVWLKEKGIKVVTDVDDFWSPDQYHPLFHIVRQRRDHEFKIKVLKAVDWVTTTTPIFASEIKNRLHIKNVLVLPNAINEEEPQYQPRPTPSELTRFGWLGGSSHQADIELLKEGISAGHYSYKGRIQFVLCGFDMQGMVTEMGPEGQLLRRDIRPEETSWYQYERVFTDDYKVLPDAYVAYLKQYREAPVQDHTQPYRRVWTRPVQSYAENYNQFDVSMAPLKDTQFNSVKSQLKVIEAGFHKKALIASAVGPYTLDLTSAVEFGGKTNQNGNALLVDVNKNHKQWGAHIKRLMDNPSMIEDLGHKLYEMVKDTYSLKTVTQTRKDFYLSIV
jgi:glycosyltransferase involved in cell wall biosynthesis